MSRTKLWVPVGYSLRKMQSVRVGGHASSTGYLQSDWELATDRPTA